ncbi:MAG: hypothetical protein IJ493_04900 [Clostridia bacterium]|nr:hypothetical protein [Clostridia bacterium]
MKRVNAEVRDDKLYFLADYGGYEVTASYAKQKGYFHVSVFGTKGAKADFLSLDGAAHREMEHMHDLLCGEPMKVDYDRFIAPVFVMNAIERSSKSGTWADVQAVTID